VISRTRTEARLLRDLDDRRPEAIARLVELYPLTGRAYVVGVTGNPGAGKSTLVDQLIAHYRAAGERIACVLVDPTSPFSGGAILGDRIRMTRHATDPDVFIKSVATRGHLGGLSRSTFDLVAAFDALGYARIIVETVGVGQDEVDVMRAAHATVVVAVPGLGDEVQAIKGGLLEVADVLCVNKADRDGAERTARDLQHMASLRIDAPEIELVRTVAPRGDGVAELVAAIERHRLRHPPASRAAARRRAHIEELVRSGLAERAAVAMAQEVGEGDPWTVAARILDGLT